MALRKITSLFGIIAFAAMMIFVFTGCEEPKSPPLKVIDIASIQGVTVPVTGGIPVTAITENAQYRGTVTWSYNPVAFIANVQYTATINLTPKSGYTLKGVEANFFTVAGATSVSNNANSGIITAVFPSGCSITIDMFDSDGNGWDRAALKIEVNGTVLSTNATIISGDTNSYVFNVTNGDSVNIYWISGDYDSECSFIMYYTDKPPIPEFTANNNSSWSGVNALFYKSFNTLNNISSGALISSFTVEGRTIIDIAAIKGVTIPVIGGIPVTAITENAQYVGTVTWNGNPSVFIASTAYTATITLTPKAGYTLHGVAANFFTVTGAASVSNAANSGIVTVVFPVTAKINLSISITAPVKSATPTATANSNTESGSNFTIGQVSWSPSHNPFLGGTVYTASVTLTANGGYTFTGLSSATVNGQNAEVSNNTGSAVTLSYTFPATNTKTVTDIAIKSQPTKLTYTHGDTLDLTGLVITLTHDDTTTEDVSAADFTAKNVTVIPAQGNNLIHSMHNGQPIKISYGSLTMNTNNLTVNKATPTAADFNISGTKTFAYDGNSKAVTITPKEAKSSGTITVKYNGSETEPSVVGTYTVTFDVEAVTDYNSVSNLSAGTLSIIDAIFNNIDSFRIYLQDKHVNNVNNPYTVALNVNNLDRSLEYVLKANNTKYVNLDLSGSNFTSIERFAFFGCTSLTGLTLPDSVTSIGETVFTDCASLTAINVDSGNIVYTAENGVLFNKNKTKLIVYPAGKIDTIFSIPDSVTTIGDSAFRGCTSLTSITIPDSVTSIGQETFAYCTSLTSVTIPDNVTSIGEAAFASCTKLTSVTIGNSVTSIGAVAFLSCTSLTSVTIPDSVTSIGISAFGDTAWFNNQPNGLVYAGKVAYRYKGTMPANTNIILLDGTKGIADEAFYNCKNLTSVTIPDSVISIGGGAFQLCTGLTSITIPTSITSIGYGPFSRCTSLITINVETGNSNYSSEQGILYNKNKTVLIQYPGGKAGAFIIPNSVTTIGDAAFRGCTSLTSVTIGNGVTSIGDSAFDNCTSLTSVKFEGTIRSISSYSFPGDLRTKYLAGTGGIGTYTRESSGTVWTKISN